MVRDNELGEFLRARRALISPSQAGLPDSGDRRVSGLRREEVALLAGVSADYYTRIEQGRERRPSEQVLDAICRSLHLDAHSATHLFRLVQPAPQSAIVASASTVSPELLRLMDYFVDAPCCVLGPALDVLAANASAEVLYSGFDRFDNILRMVFLDPHAPDFYSDWDQAARGAVSNLRSASAAFQDDPRVTAIVGELCVRSPAFASIWVRHEVRPRTGDYKRLRQPRIGELYLHYQGFTVLDAPGQQLFVYTAEPGSPSADGLRLIETLAAETRTDAERVESGSGAARASGDLRGERT